MVMATSRADSAAALAGIVVDRAGRIVAVDDFWVRRFGPPGANLRDGLRVIVGEVPENLISAILAVADTHVEYVALLPRGEPVWMVRAEPVEGGVRATVGSLLHLNCADGRLSYEDVAARAMRYGTTQLLVIGQKGEIRFVGGAPVGLSGLTVSQLDRSALDLVHPEDRSRVARELARVLSAPGRMVTTQLRVNNVDGREAWATCQAINCMDDPMIEGLLVLVTDSTAHHRAVTEQDRLEQELELRATHDDLTGLPNRAEFLDRLAGHLHEDRIGAGLGVLFVDLDNFKSVNDTLGHEQGDSVLVEMARRLSLGVRTHDVVARFGGDEFVVMCPDVNSDLHLRAMAERLGDGLRAPVLIGNQEYHPTASIGVALSHRSCTAASLIRDADAALYRAKESGRNQVVFFDEALRSRAAGRRAVEGELRNAIEGELVVLYQPIVDLATRDVLGVEALVRWDHPTRGLLAPIEFLDVAEETGLVVQLGEFVLGRACADIAPLGIELSVNLSARQLVDSSLMETVDRMLRASGLPPSRLRLEVTETVLMRDVKTSAKVLASLRELGVSIGVDDFGTGYSSLAYLRRLPIDALKVDRSFVSRLAEERHDHEIVKAVLFLANALELTVVAEGIETETQRQALRRLGCTQGQGYLFARPAPIVDVPRMIADLPVWAAAGVR